MDGIVSAGGLIIDWLCDAVTAVSGILKCTENGLDPD